MRVRIFVRLSVSVCLFDPLFLWFCLFVSDCYCRRLFSCVCVCVRVCLFVCLCVRVFVCLFV